MVKENKVDVVLLVMVFLSGVIVGIIVYDVITDVSISQETADDVCQQLTNDSAAIASNTYNKGYTSKLICKIPSFDSTQNIIIERNNE